MLSLAMIRVEPGSTPGIGITITEHFFFGFFVFCGMFFRFAFCSFVRCLLRFAFCKGNWSHVILQQQRCWKKKFDTYCYLPYYRYLVLGTTYYIKSDKVDKEHGYTGGTYLMFPPSWPSLPTSYNRND